MPMFKATEFASPELATGQVEYYMANSKEEAVNNLLYTRRLVDGKAHVGVTGNVVYASGSAWFLMEDS